MQPLGANNADVLVKHRGRVIPNNQFANGHERLSGIPAFENDILGNAARRKVLLMKAAEANGRGRGGGKIFEDRGFCKGPVLVSNDSGDHHQAKQNHSCDEQTFLSRAMALRSCPRMHAVVLRGKHVRRIVLIR